MASPLNSSVNGAGIPIYDSNTVNNWIGAQQSTIDAVTVSAVVLIALIGFICFALGVMRYMGEVRDGERHSGSKSGALTLIVVGLVFGAADAIFLLFVSIWK